MYYSLVMADKTENQKYQIHMEPGFGPLQLIDVPALSPDVKKSGITKLYAGLMTIWYGLAYLTRVNFTGTSTITKMSFSLFLQANCLLSLKMKLSR